MKELSKGKIHSPWLVSALLLLLSFVLYGRSLNHEFAVDDYPAIVNNTLVKKGVVGIPKLVTHSFYYGYDRRKEANEYRPFVSAFFALEYQVFGSHAGWYHLLNILLYFGILWSLFLLLKNWLDIRSALIATILFAMVPVHSEVVLNVKAQDDLWVCLFILLSFQFYLKEKRNFLAWSLVFYTLAVFSKASALPFLLIFPSLDWLRTNKLKKQGFLFILPAALYLIARHAFIEGVEKIDVVNNALAFSSGYSEQSAMGFALFYQYILKLLFPYPLSWDYSYNHFALHGWMHWQSIVGLLLFLALVYLILRSWKKPTLISWLSFFFLLSIGLYLQLVILIESTFAERFLLLPSLAFVVALVVLFREKKWANGLWITLGIAWAAIVWARVPDWKNNTHLFSADISKVPNSTRANTALAFNLYERAIATENTNEKLLLESAEYYRKAINIYGNDGSTWYNYGMCNLALGEYTMAELCFKDCLRLEPEHTLAFNNLGNIQYLKGEHELAKYYYTKAIQIDPKNSEAWSNLGAEYLLSGRNDSAYYALETAVHLDPKNENAIYNRNVVMKRLGITPTSSGQ